MSYGLTQIVRACVKGSVEFELADAKFSEYLRQLDQTAYVDELQVASPSLPLAFAPADADIVIHPESDVAAEIARLKDAEKPVSKSAVGTKRRGVPGGQSALEVPTAVPVNWK